ncbi:MAG: plastocyanin/azurin family copper-binding protein [Actinomycetota bacterium]|nr:plastocyanin/azurin family copper-binding protein [Actinomycetota bacterium]
MAKIREKSRALLTAGAVLLPLFGCTGHPSTPTGPVLDVKVKDFKIEPSLSEVENGLVTLRVWNEGPTTHEFVVIRSDLAADELPIGADGLSVDEDRVVPLDELSEVGAGASSELTLALSAGQYVLFCNFEGHYLAGMNASVEVTNDV